jgi:hypothetical protein
MGAEKPSFFESAVILRKSAIRGLRKAKSVAVTASGV